MHRSTNSLVFPDINVWLAMASSAHIHHVQARSWFYSLADEDELLFCRFTQLGFLRLLTTAGVMGDQVRTQRQAWQVYDGFIEDGNARLVHEPHLLERSLRKFATLDSASPKDWADSYLAAFAEKAFFSLVTFDKALASKAEGAVLLRV